MPNSVVYLAIYLPLLFLGILFYISTVYVLIKKRKSPILGTSFFKIHIVLGILEITTSLNVQFHSMFPKYGLFVDNFYLVYVKGFWAQLSMFTNSSLGVTQFSIISLVALNRIVALVGYRKFNVDHFNKISISILIGCIVVPFILDTPIFFMTDASLIDFRINSTDITSLNMIAMYSFSNEAVTKYCGTIVTATKTSNLIFNSLLFIMVLWVLWKQKSEHNSNKNNLRNHEIKLSIAVIFLAILNGISSFLMLGLFYFWSSYATTVLEYIFPLEDCCRMVTPIMLFIFSAPLRKAFREIYYKNPSVHATTITFIH